MRNGILNNGLKSRIFITAGKAIAAACGENKAPTPALPLRGREQKSPPEGDLGGLYVPQAQYNIAQRQRLGQIN